MCISFLCVFFNEYILFQILYLMWEMLLSCELAGFIWVIQFENGFHHRQLKDI